MSAKVCPQAFPGSAFQGMTPDNTTEHHTFRLDEKLPTLSCWKIYFSTAFMSSHFMIYRQTEKQQCVHWFHVIEPSYINTV